MRGPSQAEQGGASASSAACHKQWSLVNSDGPCPMARSGHSTVVAKESLYIFGGCGQPAELPRCSEDGAEAPSYQAADAMPICLGDLHVYDLARQRWSEVACHDGSHEVQPVERTCAAMCASEEEDRLFLSGGAGDNPRDLRADLYEFDVRHRTWRLLYDGAGTTAATTAAVANLSKVCPCRRIGHAMVHDAARNRLLIFGGSKGDEYFDDTHSFNLDKSAWAVLVTTGDRPSPRYKHQAFIDGDSMYVVGGGSFEPEGPHLDVYRLHLAGARALEWERIRPIGEPPRCRAAHGLAWDRVGRAAYIWGGFTSGMELDCTFHALRLPLPSSIPETTASSDAGASSSPVLASRNRASIPSGLGAAASDDSSAYDDADAHAVLADIITSETAENAFGAARSLDSTASLAVLGAGIGEGLGGATSGTTETAEQRQHQVQQGHQPLAQWDYELRPTRVPGQDFWRRRGPCLWRQGTREQAGASGPTVTYRRPRDDRGRMGSWGQGWTTDRLQGLWGGGSPPSSSASPSPADANTDSVEVVDVASTFIHDSRASVMLWTNCSAAQGALRASKAAVDEDLMRWVSLPSRSSLGSDTDSSPSPSGRSFHCVVFHGGSVYVTGGSDGDRKFGDMWRFSASESPPPLTTLAARALVLNLAAVGDGSGGRSDLLMELPEGVPTELREALANLNMQAEVVL